MRAADTGTAEPLYELFVEQICAVGIPTQTGGFGAHMDVTLVNEGPTTICFAKPMKTTFFDFATTRR